MRSRGPSRQRQRPRPASASRARAPVAVPAQKVTSSPARTPPAPTRSVAQVQGNEDAFEYEYYYDYLDEDNSQLNPDYDLVPLANKVTSSNRTYKLTLQVQILLDGLPHCLDVGVFPNPFSCKNSSTASGFQAPGSRGRYTSAPPTLLSTRLLVGALGE